VTCAANAAIAEIHNRIPVVPNERAAEDWNPREQDPLSLERLLMPAPCDLLSVRPGSPPVNSIKNEGPALGIRLTLSIRTGNFCRQVVTSL
jgi:putative SOS response-associated peptidase YedK